MARKGLSSSVMRPSRTALSKYLSLANNGHWQQRRCASMSGTGLNSFVLAYTLSLNLR